MSQASPEPQEQRRVVGTAADAKSGAVLVGDDDSVRFVHGLDAWPAGWRARRVEVTGRESREAVAPEAFVNAAGEVSQGVAPDAREAVLREAAWRPLHPVPEGPWRVVFSDGSGNLTEIEGDGAAARFSYKPVRPRNSSSGEYSGGAPAHGEVPSARLEHLWSWIAEVTIDPAVVALRRELGTGMLDATTVGGTRTRMLRPEAARGFVRPDASPGSAHPSSPSQGTVGR